MTQEEFNELFKEQLTPTTLAVFWIHEHELDTTRDGIRELQLNLLRHEMSDDLSGFDGFVYTRRAGSGSIPVFKKLSE